MSSHSAEPPETELMHHQLHAVELRRRAALLREQAERARDHALQAVASTERRRGRASGTREQVEFEAEQARSTRELAAYITGLRREQEVLRAEAVLQQDWFREQAMAMLDQGWSREELADIGFGEAFLAELGLPDVPGPQRSS